LNPKNTGDLNGLCNFIEKILQLPLMSVIVGDNIKRKVAALGV
jgi:hypothetical protein